MKFLLFFSLIFPLQVAAKTIGLSCNKLVLVCPNPGQGRCLWSGGPGQLFSLPMTQISSNPQQETWQAKDLLDIEGQKAKIEIHRVYRQSQKFDFLSLEMQAMPEITVSASGGEFVLLKFEDSKARQGTSLRCTTAVRPGP